MSYLGRAKYKIGLVWLALLLVLGLVLGACGDTNATIEGTVIPTSTPRPVPTFETPTPVPLETPNITATPIPSPTRNTRTPIPTPTRTPTPNPRITPTATPNPSATPIVLTPTDPTTTPRPGRAIGGDLVTARDRDPSSLHPYGLADTPAKEYRALLYDAKLLKRNPQTLEWESNAAYAFKYDEASRSVAFVLRKNLRWSDGTPITTDDFIFTYQFIIDAGRGWLDLPLYAGKIESYFAPDKYTLLVKLRDKYSNPLELANLVEPVPKHIWDGQSWAEADKNTNIMQPKVVSGPWKLKEWKANDRITFVRNELSSSSPPPYANSLTFLRADQKQALEMLRKGEIDFYTPTPDKVAELDQMAKVVVYRWDSTTPSWSYLGFNFRRQMWQTPAVRQALNSVIDRSELLKEAAYGLGTPQYSDIPPGHPAFATPAEKPVYDVEKGRDLMLSAGYRLNGFRLNGLDGNELPEISLLYNIEGEARKKQADYLAGQLAKLGLKIKLVPLDNSTLITRLQEPTGDYDLFLYGWKPNTPNIEQFGVSWQGNYGGYKNPTLTDLYAKANKEPDKNARYELLKQIQQLEEKELPYIYLYANQEYIGVTGTIGGVEESPLGVTVNRYTDWFIK